MEMWRTFVLERGYILKINSGHRLFCLYSLYRWGAPLIV